MAIGLRLPVGVSGSGGAALVSGEENDRKIIFTALGTCANENAFQQEIGLGDDMVFDLSDPALKARILRRLIRIFEDFVVLKRYALVPSSIAFKENATAQELILEFKYTNLETDERLSFTRRFSRG
jgi:hypothetical protein